MQASNKHNTTLCCTFSLFGRARVCQLQEEEVCPTRHQYKLFNSKQKNRFKIQMYVY